MSYVPVDVPAFGGLDLRDPEDATGSPDLLNVFEVQPGKLVCRAGLGSVVGSTNLGSTPTGLVAYSPGGLACGFGTTVRTFTTAGATTASTTGLTSGTWSSVAIGGYAYFANGYDYVLKAGATHTTGAASASTKAIGATSFTGSRKMPKPLFVGRQPKDNRLVAAGFLSADGPNALATVTLGDGSTVAVDSSTVFFSQPDSPAYWDETDWVMLDRGDGEAITAVETFNDQLYIFKSSKFFVFYGNSTDADGGAVFNFRKVDCPAYVRATVSHTSGLYFATNNGIFVTTGGVPRRVSEPVDYLFNGTYLPFVGAQGFTYGPLVFFPMCTPGNGLFNGYWLVLDTDTGKWWLWKYAEGVSTGVEWYGYVYCPRDNATGIYKFDPYGTATTDNGTAFTSYYTSAYSALGSPGVEKTIRQTELRGTGTVDLSWGKDRQAHGYSRGVTMLNGRGLDRTAVRGETLSWKVSGSGWTLNRVVPFLREQRASGVVT